MKMIVKNFFSTMLLGSALVFAIGSASVNASPISECIMENKFNNFEDGDFWSKFKDSIMKDKPPQEDDKRPPDNDDKPMRHSPPPHR